MIAVTAWTGPPLSPSPCRLSGLPCLQLFVGNFDYEAHPRDVEKLIDRYGDVERIDMKMGACQRSGHVPLARLCRVAQPSLPRSPCTGPVTTRLPGAMLSAALHHLRLP